MNEEEENKICMGCCKCCESYWIFTDVPEEVERFETLETNNIEVIKIKDRLWKIMFHFKCKHLRGSKCEIYDKYDKLRPKYCPEYPKNFLGKDTPKEVLENEIKFCPLLAKLHIINV